MSGRRVCRRSGGLWALVLAFVLAYGLLSVRTVPLWDGAFYYAWLRSAVVDGDWDLSNDIQLVGERSGDPLFGTLGMESARTPTGRIRNPFPIGSALMWAPLYAPMHLAWRALAGVGQADGFGLPYTWLLSGMGAGFVLLGMLLTYRICRRRAGPFAATLGCLVAWLASPLLHYAFREPGYSHAASAFLISLFVWLWWRDDRPWTWGRALLLGGVLGLAALVRAQNILYLALPAGELLALGWREARAGRWPAAWGWLLGMGFCAVAIFSPQMATWKVFYGSPFTIPQDVDFREMQGTAFMQWLSPALGATLFSSFHGLFAWQPAALLGSLGLLLGGRRELGRRGLALLGMALQIYLVACAGDWFGGGGFGPRRMDSLTPFLALGLTALADLRTEKAWRWGWSLLAGVLIFGEWVLLMVGYPAGIGGSTGLELRYVATGLPAFYRDWLDAAGLALREPWRLIVEDAPLYRLAHGQCAIGLAAWCVPGVVLAGWGVLAWLGRRLYRRCAYWAALSACAAILTLNVLILWVW